MSLIVISLFSENIIPNIEIDRLDCPALILQRGAQWLEIQSRGRVTVN